MSSKMGRPKIDNPMSVDVKVRITVETDERLSDYCERENLTKAEVLRYGLKLVLDEKK